MKNFIFVTLLLVMSSCSGVQFSSANKNLNEPATKTGNADSTSSNTKTSTDSVFQPTTPPGNIAGQYLSSLECNLSASEDSGAISLDINCRFFDEKRNRIRSQIDVNEISASLLSKGSSKSEVSVISSEGKDYDFSVRIGIKSIDPTNDTLLIQFKNTAFEIKLDSRLISSVLSTLANSKTSTQSSSSPVTNVQGGSATNTSNNTLTGVTNPETNTSTGSATNSSSSTATQVSSMPTRTTTVDAYGYQCGTNEALSASIGQDGYMHVNKCVKLPQGLSVGTARLTSATSCNSNEVTVSFAIHHYDPPIKCSPVTGNFTFGSDTGAIKNGVFCKCSPNGFLVGNPQSNDCTKACATISTINGLKVEFN